MNPEIETLQKVEGALTALDTETKSIRKTTDQIKADSDRWEKDIKKAMDELTLVKNTVNDQAKLGQKLAEFERRIALLARHSFSDPVLKFQSNEQNVAFLNAAVRMAAFPGEYNRLPSEWRKLLEESAARTKSLTGVDSGLGQATVPTEVFDSIYDTLQEYGDWSKLGVLRVGARTNTLPVATARPGYYWIGAGTGGTAEGSAITEGSFTGTSVSLVIQTLGVYLTAARELLADSTADMSGYILKQLAQSIAYGLDFAAFTADGGADQVDAGYYGMFAGATVNANLAAAATAGNTSIASLQLEDFVRCLTTVSPVVLKRRAAWFMSPTVLAQVCLIRDENGRPIFQTANEAPAYGGMGSILGFPVHSIAAAPSTDSAGAAVAVFGDPEGQAVGIRSDLELATSADVKFAENLLAFRALMRAGVKTRTSGTTLKPFAVLKLAAQ